MRGPRALLAALAAALVIMFVVDGAKVHRKTVGKPLDDLNDFGMFWEAGRRIWTGEDPFSVPGFGFSYPAPAYLVFAAFALLPIGVAVIAWHVTKLGLLGGSLRALWRLLARAGLDRPELVLVLATLGIGRSLDSDLQLGQVNLLVLALVVGMAWAFLTHRDEVAGLLLAAAALFKVTPALFVVYFAWKRRWRVIAWSAVGAVLLGVLVPATLLGPSRTADMWRTFVGRTTTTVVATADGPAPQGGYRPGQSLLAVVQRWVSPVQAVSPGRVEEPTMVNLIDLGAGPARALAIGAVLVLLAVFLVSTWPVRDEPRHTPRALLELGIVAGSMLLAAPYARKAHFVSLALPLAAVFAYALKARSRGLLVATGLAALLPLLTSPEALGRPLSVRLTAYGPFTLAALLLVVGAIVAVARERRRERELARRPSPTDLQLSVFFPAYNEGKNIRRVVEGALAVLPRVATTYEVIVVDDASKDDTADVVEALAREHPRVVRHVRHAQNRGYGGAVKTGLAEARYDWVFFTDGDGQFDLGELPAFCQPLSDPDVGGVIGYRRKRRDPLFRLVNAYCWGALVRTLFGLGARDVDCAYKVLPTRLVQRLDLKAEGALISTELLAKLERAGCRFAERGVTHLPRVAGTPTGADPRVILRAFVELFRFRRELASFRLRDAPATARG